MISQERAEGAMQIILHAGDARLRTTEALRALAGFDFQAAREALVEAKKEVTEAHTYQTVELQREAEGNDPEFSVLVVHAQDTCMTVYSEMTLAEHLIEIAESIDSRLKALEGK